MLFSSASAMVSSRDKYRFPPRTSESKRLELERLIGDTIRHFYGSTKPEYQRGCCGPSGAVGGSIRCSCANVHGANTSSTHRTAMWDWSCFMIKHLYSYVWSY